MYIYARVKKKKETKKKKKRCLDHDIIKYVLYY